ncbi:hypothetical protein K470DRAFT_254587 [Piedraia hortae CBS 480.64]|uniref:Uncharacterized protein n=1 Tax=Piedraia hortae CBS 480.64 TaxID=1314780 RepID=A0A6A7C8F3_9PEZI|nr:hypothetical protein K470DRAFT_254587 [Piedraia hortae CBS 480.64]
MNAETLRKGMANGLTEQTQLTKPSEVIALATHSVFTTQGFWLVADGRQRSPYSLPAGWNSGDYYTFRYRHSDTEQDVNVEIKASGTTVTISGHSNLEIKVADYIFKDSLPAKTTSLDKVIADNKLQELGSLIRDKLIRKALSGKEDDNVQQRRDQVAGVMFGQDERGPTHPHPGEEPDKPAKPHPLTDPLAHPQQPRRGPLPEPIPGFEDEHELQRGPRPPFSHQPPSIGERDLYPQGLGPNDPFRGPSGLGPMGGGGMHPTFDDPLFGGRGGMRQGYDPQHPPGSRFDDPGPNFGHGGMGGRPPNPFGGFGSDDFI